LRWTGSDVPYLKGVPYKVATPTFAYATSGMVITKVIAERLADGILVDVKARHTDLSTLRIIH
jgi:hypothetical protein